MSSNFYTSSHNLYHIYPRPTLFKARAIDRLYASPRQLLCLSIWFANLIQKVGKKLMLRQVPIATATIYFKRFYLKNAYCETNPYLVLAACLLVAAKVEETPVHIKSVVSEAKAVLTELGIKTFPAEAHKLGEMEFYLLEDLDFHLIVFHPYRSLLAICGREASDAGTYPQSRIHQDIDIKNAEAEARKKRDEEIRKAGPGARTVPEEGPEEESEEARVIRLMRRGSGEGLMEIEESVLQISIFLLNDTYRTDVHLLYPPHIVALAVLYIGFTLSSMTPTTRSRSHSTQQTFTLSASEINAALSIPSPPTAPAEFLASFQVNLPVLMACVQEIIVLYPVWEKFEPVPLKGKQPAEVNTKTEKDGIPKFLPEDAERLVQAMIDERMTDIMNNEKDQLAGKKRQR